MAMNWAQVTVQLDPNYQAKARLLRDRLESEAYLEQYRARNSFELEQYRSSRNLELEQFKADKSEQNTHLQGKYARELEELRSQARTSEIGQIHSNQKEMAALEHRNKLLQLQAEFINEVQLESVKYQRGVYEGIDKMHADSFASMARTLEAQQGVYGNILQTFAGAMLAEAAAQNAHGRHLETLTAQEAIDQAARGQTHGHALEARAYETVMRVVEHHLIDGHRADAEAAIDRALARCDALGI